MREKFLQIVCLIRDYYPEYIENSYNSVIKRLITQMKKWAKDISSKRIHK